MRKARVDPEYAHLYPDAPPGVWVRAAALSHVILKRHRADHPNRLPTDRILPDEHFSFAGGRRRLNATREARTRMTDQDRRRGASR